MMNNFKNGGMMKQVMQMQKQLKKAQRELERDSVTGKSSNGAVQIELTGSQKCKSVIVDDELLKGKSKSDIEKMIAEAVSDALDKSKELMKEKLGPLSGGLPGLNI